MGGVPGGLCRYEAGDRLWGTAEHRLWGASVAEPNSRVVHAPLPKSAGRCIAGMMETHDCGASRSRGPRGHGWRSPTHPPKRLNDREERAALWAALGLPPHERRVPDCGNRDETFPVSRWSRKRSYKMRDTPGSSFLGQWSDLRPQSWAVGDGRRSKCVFRGMLVRSPVPESGGRPHFQGFPAVTVGGRSAWSASF